MIDVAVEHQAIFARDGRVFVDMDVLLASIDAPVASMERGLKWMDEQDDFVEGMREMVNMVERSRDELRFSLAAE